MSSGEALDRLAAVVAERASAGDATSYTRSLIAKGVPKIAKKVGEEAVEVAIAAVEGDRDALTGELADLVYHMLVLMQATHISLGDVTRVLEGRMGQSGLAEKAARTQP